MTCAQRLKLIKFVVRRGLSCDGDLMPVEFSSAAGLRYSDTVGNGTLVCNDWGDAQLVWIDDSRTLIPIDQPEALTACLREFLAANS